MAQVVTTLSGDVMSSDVLGLGIKTASALGLQPYPNDARPAPPPLLNLGRYLTEVPYGRRGVARSLYRLELIST